MSKHIRIALFCLVLGCLLMLTACTLAKKASLGEEFTMQEGQIVKINGESLTLELHTIGREWTEDYETPFAELTLTTKGQEQEITLYMGDSWKIGGHEVAMTRSDPFGHSPECDLIVTRP